MLDFIEALPKARPSLSSVAALAFAVAMAATAPPALSQGVEPNRNEANVCAVDYTVLSMSATLQREIFNMEEIDLEARSQELARRFEIDEGRIVDAAVERLYGPMRASGPQAEAQLLLSVAQCDRRFGFQPVIALTEADALNDLECIARYWALGAVRPETQPHTSARIQHVGRAYIAANQGASEETIRREIMPRVQARATAIRTGAETINALSSDIAACEAKYGFGP